MPEEAAKIPGSNPGGPINCLFVVRVNKNVYYILIFETSLSSDSNIEIFLSLLPEPSLLENITKIMEQL